jgi:CRISPR-associated protein Csx17
MPEIKLEGCTPEPLMSYLKALGVFRLVAEQEDSEARLSWRSGTAQLHSKLEREGLEKFFLEQYRPTPILAPWNGGSGFYGDDEETKAKKQAKKQKNDNSQKKKVEKKEKPPLERLLLSKSSRLVLYRESIARIRPYLPAKKPKDEDKASLLASCRMILGDEVVPWLDVCFVLGQSGPNFFPLLGTGGNDGRLDFTNNFMQRLADVIPFNEDRAKENSNNWLTAGLFGNNLTALGKSAVGQFNPGGIGGANGTQGRFEADSRVNPWDFVLMIEGALLFAGSVARRMGADNSGDYSAFPFCVEGIIVGNGSFSQKEARERGKEPPNGGELWLPLWNQPIGYRELKYLFAEGRAQFGRRQARNAVEFGLAVNLLGVSRGIESFSRVGFLRRNGKAFLATPLGRVLVQERPSARLLNDQALLNWLDHFRNACRETDGKRDNVPTRYKTALRQIDRTMFAFANRSEKGNDTKYLLDVLAALGRAERTLASEGLSWLKDKQYGWKLNPLRGLNHKWLEQANDDSAEFRLAASLAGARSTKDNKVSPLRVFIEAVEATKSVSWSPGSTLAVWSKRPLSANLAALFLRRQMESFRSGLVGVPLCSPRPARLDDVLTFLNEETDDDKLHDLLWGLLLLDWSKVEKQSPMRPKQHLPFEFGVPRLLVQGRFFAPRRVAVRHPQTGAIRLKIVWQTSKDTEKINAKPDPEVFQALATCQKDAIEQCVTRCAQQLKSGGLLVTGYRNRRQAGKPLNVVSPGIGRAERLLASMLFPLTNHDLERIANAVLYPPELEE